jgi:hypothetical protein
MAIPAVDPRGHGKKSHAFRVLQVDIRAALDK